VKREKGKCREEPVKPEKSLRPTTRLEINEELQYKRVLQNIK
jgi:hypothetical protein